MFFCSSCVLGWFVGTGIKVVRRTREVLLNLNRSTFLYCARHEGDPLFSELFLSTCNPYLAYFSETEKSRVTILQFISS